jgi:maltooligosyltrehalose synthase
MAGLLADSDLPPMGALIWEDTRVLFPFSGCSGKYRNIFTGAILEIEKAGGHAKVPVSEIVAEFPVAVCVQA